MGFLRTPLWPGRGRSSRLHGRSSSTDAPVDRTTLEKPDAVRGGWDGPRPGTFRLGPWVSVRAGNPKTDLSRLPFKVFLRPLPFSLSVPGAGGWGRDNTVDLPPRGPGRDVPQDDGRESLCNCGERDERGRPDPAHGVMGGTKVGAKPPFRGAAFGGPSTKDRSRRRGSAPYGPFSSTPVSVPDLSGGRDSPVATRDCGARATPAGCTCRVTGRPGGTTPGSPV